MAKKKTTKKSKIKTIKKSIKPRKHTKVSKKSNKKPQKKLLNKIPIKKEKIIIKNPKKEHIKIKKEGKTKFSGFLKGLFKKKEKNILKKRDEVKTEDDPDLKNLEKQIMDLGKVFDSTKEIKPQRKGFFSRFSLKKDPNQGNEEVIKESDKIEEKEIVEEHKVNLAKIEDNLKLKKESKLFTKCKTLMDKAELSFDDNKINKAKKLYNKSKKLYVKLDYQEKKNLHDELLDLYNKLSK